MFLAGSLYHYHDEVIADLAETYNIYEYKSHPIKRVAILVSQLSNDSRLKRKLADINYSRSDLILASISDGVQTILWSKTKDGQKGLNRPKSLLKNMLNENQKENKKAFRTGEDFEVKRKQLLKKIQKGG